jgi:hypothetical protein
MAQTFGRKFFLHIQKERKPAFKEIDCARQVSILPFFVVVVIVGRQ